MSWIGRETLDLTPRDDSRFVSYPELIHLAIWSRSPSVTRPVCGYGALGVALYLTLTQERFAVLSLETWCREYCT
jgi:hypothetical protein